MKLSAELVDKIAAFVLGRLKDKELILLKVPEEKVLDKIRSVILADMRAEDALDREVDELIKAHSAGVDADKVDYRKMFSMIKHKLARERGIVL